MPWEGWGKEENVLYWMFHCAGKYICSNSIYDTLKSHLYHFTRSCYVNSFSPTYLSAFSIMALTPIKWISHFSTVKGGFMNFSTLVTKNEWRDYYQSPSYKTKSLKELKRQQQQRKRLSSRRITNPFRFVCFSVDDFFFLKADIRSCFKTITLTHTTTLTSRTERWCNFFNRLAL